MAAITNPPFRQICLELGAGVAHSEMLSAEQILRAPGPAPIERCPSERVLIVQLYGRVPRLMAEAASIAEDLGADVIDINMGCPARKVVHQGCGVSLMLEPDLAAMITEAVCNAVSIPVTVKMRTGFSRQRQNATEIARIVVASGARGVVVHARSREAGHTGPTDWDVVADVRDALPPEIPVTGNGGITDLASAQALAAASRCDGLMIGRAARGNPWIFASLAAGREVRPDSEELRRVVLRHFELYLEWGGEDRAVREMRKHLIWYTKGIPGATQIRRALSGLAKAEDLSDLISSI